MNTKEQINQQFKQLNEEQLKQVANFIAFLKFREKLIKPNLNTEKLAQLYQEFAEEDRQLAEEGINEYANLLTQEDRLWNLNEDKFRLPLLTPHKVLNKQEFVQSLSFKKTRFLNLLRLLLPSL